MAKRGPKNAKAGANPSDSLFRRPRSRKDPKTRNGEPITEAGLTGSELDAIQAQFRAEFYAREHARGRPVFAPYAYTEVPLESAA